jgi:hypothetical protein
MSARSGQKTGTPGLRSYQRGPTTRPQGADETDFFNMIRDERDRMTRDPGAVRPDERPPVLPLPPAGQGDTTR